MFKTLLTGLLVLSFMHPASALTINPLMESTFERPISGQPVLLNDRAYFLQENRYGEEAVKVFNLSRNFIERSFSGEFLKDDKLQSLFVIDDYVYLVAYDTSEYITEVWRTQGETFQRVNLPVPIDRHARLGFDNGTLFISAANNTIITLDGEQVMHQQYPQPANFSQDRCVFDASNYLMALRGTDGRFFELVRYVDGEVTELSTDYPDDFRYEVVQSGDSCLLGIIVNGVYSTLVEINAVGNQRTVNESLDLSGINRLFTFKDNWYVMGSFDQGLTSLVGRVNMDQSILDARFEVDLINQFYFVSTTDDYIVALSSTPTVSPRVDTNWYLDEDLVLNDELTSTNEPTPYSYPVLDGELIVSGEYRGNRTDHTFSYSLDPAPSTALTLTKHQLRSVITHPENDQVLLLLEHVATRRMGLYELAEQPATGFNLAGIWHDPELPSQGMVVTPGERQDGSRYLFITFYTYEDGQPLWLAGLNEMRLGKSLPTDLYRFQGGQLFAGGTPPEQSFFGTLSLKSLGCNRVEVIFIHFQQPDQRFTLERIENFNLDRPCVELTE